MTDISDITFKIEYPYPNGRPSVVLRVLHPTGQWGTVRLDAPHVKHQSFKVTVEPSNAVNPPYIQYVSGVGRGWNTFKNAFDEEDQREAAIVEEVRRAAAEAVPGDLLIRMLDNVPTLLRVMDAAFGQSETKVGTLWQLKKECLGNDPGTIGVCYETYGDQGNPSISLIFPNGNYDGFSPSDVGLFLEPEPVGVCEQVADYAFTNVGRLSRDFRDGRFAEVWT